MNIYLVRHAQVEERYQGRYNGDNDISLSTKGIKQAYKLGQKLSHIRFNIVYSSDLKRARESLQEFHIKNSKIIYTKKLREKSWGIHEGMSFEEIQNSGIKYKNFEQWIEELDGEDIKSYQTRVIDYFNTIILKNKVDNILVVTHAGVIKTFLGYKRGLSLEDAFGIKLEYGEYIKLTF